MSKSSKKSSGRAERAAHREKVKDEKAQKKLNKDEKAQKKLNKEESTAVFKPAVELEEMKVESGEKEEEIVYSQRAKLFVYGETLLDVGSGKKTWKERGIGDIQILQDSKTNKLRVLMRQEKTMKVLVNHALDPRIALEPYVGSDRSWTWSAFDFASGEIVETIFAIRFGDSEIATVFKKTFEQLKETSNCVRYLVEQLKEWERKYDAAKIANEVLKKEKEELVSATGTLQAIVTAMNDILRQPSP